MPLPLDRHWKNVGWVLSVEIFWGPALALISIVAILPVFLAQLGASNTVIAAMPVVWILTTGLSGAFAAPLTAGLTRRKRPVIALHAVAALPWIIIAAWFGLRGARDHGVDILVFLLAWSAAWVIMGFTIPIWIDFIGRVTRPDLRARSFGTIFFFQTLLGTFGGWVASRIIGGGLAFPANYAVGFLIAAACMAVGALFFLPVAEEEGASAERGAPLEMIGRYAREILADRTGLRVYLAVLVLSTVCFLLITFYPVYATRRLGLTPRDSAIYTAVCMAGQMLGSVLTGMIGDRFGYARVAVIALVALCTGLGLAVLGTGATAYYSAAFALGVFLVADRLALYNLSMAFCPHEDNTAYLGLIPALLAPASATVAALSGPAIDAFGFLPAARIGLAAAIVGLYLVVFRLPEPRYSLAGRRSEAP